MKKFIIFALIIALAFSIFVYFQLRQYSMEAIEYQKELLRRTQEENVTKELDAQKRKTTDTEVQKAMDSYYENNNGK